MTRPALFPSLTAEAACLALREAGLNLMPADTRLERRDERWALYLPGNRLAWFPATARGAEELAIERKVLGLLAERCTFRTPRILFLSPAGFDLRVIVAGRVDPWGLYEESRKDRALARQIGRVVGEILIEQHSRVTQGDVQGWLSRRVSWPEPRDWIMQRLPDVTDDTLLIADIERLLALYEKSGVGPEGGVLVHGDLGLHNLVFDPETKNVLGIFDYSGAAWADRHHDFRYLVLDCPGEEMLDAACDVYEPAMHCRLDRKRIWLYNAACAASFLAFRKGIPAAQKWCGRTLAEDLAWVRSALARAM